MCLYCYLWDYGESGSQILESNLGDINTINDNSSSSSLQDAEQSQSQRGFASTSATNDTNLKVWRIVYGESHVQIDILYVHCAHSCDTKLNT